LLVPLRHSMNDECVPKIVDARASAAGMGVDTGNADDGPEQLTHSDAPVAASRVAKESSLRVCGGSSVRPEDHVVPNYPDRTRRKWQTTGLEELRLAHVNRLFTQIYILQPQAGDLA